METKICHECNESKPLDSFPKKPNGNLFDRCRKCKNIYQRKYRVLNRDRINAKERLRRDMKSNKKPKVYIGNVEKPPHVCKERGCGQQSVEYKGIIGYCKSHAMDKLYFNDYVQLPGKTSM